MAKAKMQKTPRRRTGKKRTPIVEVNGDRVSSHVNMVLDPCNAPMAPNAYRGSDGINTRLRQVLPGIASVATPYLIHVFYPRYNGLWVTAVANPNAALTTSYATPGPGQAYLLANADSQRVVAACTQVAYIGSELNRQGQIYGGVLPEKALEGATFNQLVALCQGGERVPDHLFEVKYVPTAVDENYWDTGAAAPADGGDANVLVILVNGGGVVDINLTLTNTLIAEWRPKFGIGMAVPTPNTPDAPAGLERVKSELARRGNWWMPTVRAGMQVARTLAETYATGGLRPAARLALKYF